LHVNNKMHFKFSELRFIVDHLVTLTALQIDNTHQIDGHGHDMRRSSTEQTDITTSACSGRITLISLIARL